MLNNDHQCIYGKIKHRPSSMHKLGNQTYIIIGHKFGNHNTHYSIIFFYPTG
jgi:hypothetical protein